MRNAIVGALVSALLTMAGATLGWYVRVETRFDRLDSRLVGLAGCCITSVAEGP